MGNHAIAVPRGCGGSRSPGGIYAECGTSEDGLDIVHFLIDPPVELPAGLDLVNKPQIWQPEGFEVAHLLIWIGAEYYPYVADYIEETRRFGASRKLPPTLDLERLVPGQSMMVLAHPRVRNALWEDMALPRFCQKKRCTCTGCVAQRETWDRHDGTYGRGRPTSELLANHLAGGPSPHEGPCLFKTYELIPRDAADPESEVNELFDGPRHYRKLPSCGYFYEPRGEDPSGLAPGLFAALPLTGFSLIRREDGTVNEHAAEKLSRTAWDVLETDE